MPCSHHLSILENIAFGLKRGDMTKADIAVRVEEMLKLTRSPKFAKRKPHQISGGQRQRGFAPRAVLLAKGAEANCWLE